jgi:hypothetical protein
VLLSNAATTASTMDKNMDGNHGANVTQVASFKAVSFPASNYQAPGAPFEFSIPFSTPFSYDGNGPLCWEVRVQSRQNTAAVYLDRVNGSSTNPYAIASSLGVGCIASGSGHTQKMNLIGSSAPNWPNGSITITYSGNYAPKSGIAFMAIGTSNTSFSGVPLPFEIPGTAGFPSGPCYVYNSHALILPVFTSATGAHSANLALPGDPLLVGANVFGQLLGIDMAANPLGIVTSQQVAHNLVGPYGKLPVGMTLLQGLSGTASVYNNDGLIVRFDL